MDVVEHIAARTEATGDPEDRMPRPFEDEDGERWYIDGHVSERVAIIAFVLVMEYDTACDVTEVWTLARDAKVSRVWYRPDPKDDERMIRCGRRHRDGHPFTVVELFA